MLDPDSKSDMSVHQSRLPPDSHTKNPTNPNHNPTPNPNPNIGACSIKMWWSTVYTHSIVMGEESGSRGVTPRPCHFSLMSPAVTFSDWKIRPTVVHGMIESAVKFPRNHRRNAVDVQPTSDLVQTSTRLWKTQSQVSKVRCYNIVSYGIYLDT